MAEQTGPFEPISSSQDLNAIDYLKSNHSPGTEGCPAEWLKCNILNFTPPHCPFQCLSRVVLLSGRLMNRQGGHLMQLMLATL